MELMLATPIVVVQQLVMYTQVYNGAICRYTGGGTGGGAWAQAPPLFCLDIVRLRNTISIGSSDKVNRSMKKKLQNFGSIWSILFLTWFAYRIGVVEQCCQMV